MLDMGFAPEVRRLAKAMPAERQTILFSATMPNDIAKLAAELMNDPVRVEVAPQATTVERIDQKVLFVERVRKAPLLREILGGEGVDRAIVFTKTKRGADKVCNNLKADGIGAAAIHGDKTQGARRQALSDFSRGRVNVLVATDLAARGIDVDGITHVVNYDLPVDIESYVHRIGRTARAGNSGIALSFCSPDELETLHAIQKLTRLTLPVDDSHAYHVPEAAAAALSGKAGPESHGKPSRNRGPKRPPAQNAKGRGKPRRSKGNGGAPKGNAGQSRGKAAGGGKRIGWISDLNDRG